MLALRSSQSCSFQHLSTTSDATGGWPTDSPKRCCLGCNCCHIADAGSKVSNFLWTLVAGGALMLLAQSPNMSHAEVMTAVTTAIMVTYSLVAVVLAIIQGEPARLPARLRV